MATQKMLMFLICRLLSNQLQGLVVLDPKIRLPHKINPLHQLALPLQEMDLNHPEKIFSETFKVERRNQYRKKGLLRHQEKRYRLRMLRHMKIGLHLCLVKLCLCHHLQYIHLQVFLIISYPSIQVKLNILTPKMIRICYKCPLLLILIYKLLRNNQMYLTCLPLIIIPVFILPHHQWHHLHSSVKGIRININIRQ